ncbi:MAG: ABC transporter permease, partial [Bacteroidota bacterium]
MQITDLPSFPIKLFKWFCRPEYHDDIEGDLLELYALRLKELGEKKARWAILWDVLLLFRPGIIRPIHLDIPFIPTSMYKNYLKVAWRNLMAQKLYAFINIGGLSLGLAAFLVIILYVQHETTYDRFLPGSDNIYRVYQQQIGNKFLGTDFFSVTPAHLATAMREELPEVAAATTFGERRLLIGHDEDFYWEEGLAAGKDFFKVLPFRGIAGDLNKALERPKTIVLTRSLALKLFYDLDVIGEQLTLSEKDVYTVTGVVADPPINSSLSFTYIFSLESSELYVREVKEQDWQNNSYQTFFKMYDKANPEQLQAKLP